MTDNADQTQFDDFIAVLHHYYLTALKTNRNPMMFFALLQQARTMRVGLATKEELIADIDAAILTSDEPPPVRYLKVVQ